MWIFYSGYTSKGSCTSGSPAFLVLYTDLCVPSYDSGYEKFTCDSKGYTYATYLDASCSTLLNSFTSPFNNTCSKSTSSDDTDYPYSAFSCHISDLTTTTTSSSTSSSSSNDSSFPVYAIIIVVVVPVVLLIIGVAVYFMWSKKATTDFAAVPTKSVSRNHLL